MLTRNKRAFRVPIAIHIYSSMIVVALITIVIIYVSNSFVINQFIKDSCKDRLDDAIASCKIFADAFQPEYEINNNEEFRDYMFKTIASSTDESNEASIILINFRDDEPSILWPSNSDEPTSKPNRLIYEIVNSNNKIDDHSLKAIKFEGTKYYYKLLNAKYEGESNTEDNYYILFYIDTAPYYELSNDINYGLFRSMIISILVSSVISLLIAFPLFYSSHKLSRFARRIAMGKFEPVSGIVVSREFSDLADTMNVMASKLQQTDIEQKTFFQNASHELRTPLMSIQGYAEGLKYDVFEGEHKAEAIDIIINETTRLSNLVENLLSISKMDMSRNGNYEIKKQKLDVREVTEMIISRVRGSFLLQNKELVNHISIGEQFIYANENDIFRMFENIFSNCVRYANKTVSLTVTSIDNYIVFTIEDDGPGVSPEVMNHLFERFAKGNEGKHGIGLSLAKAIAEEHQGTIEVSNKSEGGAKFTIKLPTVKALNQLTNINNNKENID